MHEIGTGSGRRRPGALSQRPDLKVTASDLSPEAAEVARENAERLGIDLEVTVEEGLPDEDSRPGDRPRPRQPALRHRLDHLRALAGDPARAADRRHRRLRRGRPRRDPRRARRDPVGLAGRLRARHPPRADDAGDARGRHHPDRLHGRRAGHGRLAPSSRERGAAGEPAGSTEAERRAKAERLRAEGIDPFPRDVPRPHQDRGDPRGATTPRQLGEGEHSEFSYRIAGRVTGQRGHGKTALPRRPRPDRDDPGLRPGRRARRGGLRADRGSRHRRHRRRRRRPPRDQARPAGDRGARGDAAGQGAARPARPLPRDLRPRHPLPPARARPDGERALARDLQAAGQGPGRRSAST